MRLSEMFATVLLVSAFASAAEAAAQSALDTIVVTATRIPQSGFDLPISITRVGSDAIQDGQLRVNLSESLDRVPGLVVRNRHNYAQDLQISSRGFGARSTFGVRGIRIYVDGIPATMPDGQGQTSHIDLNSADHIEILRGPFSSLYGNSSGGVISVFTEDGDLEKKSSVDIEAGSFGLLRYGSKISGQSGNANYVFSVGKFHTDGYRDHSAARRSNFNAKLRFPLGQDSELTVIANAADLSNAEDALGLTRAQYESNPRQAGTNALIFNTRKTVRQQQGGFVYKRQINEFSTLNATVYGGHRGTTQYQAIPVTSQLPASSSGGVIVLSNIYWGTDFNLAYRGSIAALPFQITAGVSYDALSSGRKGYNNFQGPLLGVQGTLRRDEIDLVYNVDQYVQAQVDLGSRWLLQAGLRHSSAQVGVDDHYTAPGHGDNSGSQAYHAVNPVAGITYRITQRVNGYGSYGRGFETPTLNELAYRDVSAATAGLNFSLRPSKSDNYELGIKAMISENISSTLAAFHIDTKNEIVVAANSGGRSIYQNVASTKRDGLEFNLEGHWINGISTALSYTFTKARYPQAFTSCPGSPCGTAIKIAVGNSIPGVPRNTAYGELSWRHEASGFSGTIEVHAESKVYVDDVNSDAAPGFITADLRAGFAQTGVHWAIKEFMRLENLMDRKYAGSVITNENNGRYFESAPGRAIYGGFSAEFRW